MGCDSTISVFPNLKALSSTEKAEVTVFLILSVFLPRFLCLCPCFFGIAFILIFSLMPKPEFQLLSLHFLPVLQYVAMGTVHIHSDT